MHHSHLFPLLGIMFVLFWSGEAAITPQVRQEHSNQRLLSNDDVTTKDTAIYNFVNERNEERAVTMPSMSKFKDLPGKSSSFIKKVMNLHNHCG
ncbi:Putative RxLR effector [Phytophthora palmivora]|uniref:RxLR effector n=1 Tax=Phytophthora palmivora TaxID=4796 RepID=A0A2P4XMV7_9STRA|nr:Putative RxLR effector [Phytophthora palmivora]